MAERKIRIGPDPKWQKLLTLRELTRKTGIIHELQALQLKMWPLAFTSAKTSTCEVGIETKQVIFKLEELQEVKPKNFKDRLQHLANATQRLLGGEYGVVVMLDGRKVFYGSPTSDE